jgi:hypothetical protein
VVVCDGLKGLPDSVDAVFPLATVRTCIIHLIRGTFRHGPWPGLLIWGMATSDSAHWLLTPPDVLPNPWPWSRNGLLAWAGRDQWRCRHRGILATP